MRILKTYTTTISNRKDLKMIRDLYNLSELKSEKTSSIYYNDDSSFKIGSECVIVPLKKVKQGMIIYMCDRVYGIGCFIFITDKEFEKLNLLPFKCVPKVYIDQWRYLFYYEEILNEFKHPLDFVKEQETKLQNDQEQLQYNLEILNKEKTELHKRFKKK